MHLIKAGKERKRYKMVIRKLNERVRVLEQEKYRAINNYERKFA